MMSIYEYVNMCLNLCMYYMCIYSTKGNTDGIMRIQSSYLLRLSSQHLGDVWNSTEQLVYQVHYLNTLDNYENVYAWEQNNYIYT